MPIIQIQIFTKCMHCSCSMPRFFACRADNNPTEDMMHDRTDEGSRRETLLFRTSRSEVRISIKAAYTTKHHMLTGTHRVSRPAAGLGTEKVEPSFVPRLS